MVIVSRSRSQESVRELRIVTCSNKHMQLCTVFLSLFTVLVILLVLNTAITQHLLLRALKKAEGLFKMKDEELQQKAGSRSSAQLLGGMRLLAYLDPGQALELNNNNSRKMSSWRNKTIKKKGGFQWPAERSICKGPGKVLLILIHSRRTNKGNRRIIRETWGSRTAFKNWTISAVFLLGAPDKEERPEWTAEIQAEAAEFEDMALKTSFTDTYHNLSYKHVMGYEWASKFCPDAGAVLKSDDDFVVDVFKIIESLISVGRVGRRYFCRVYSKRQPMRDPDLKWYVSTREYAPDSYPRFCSGGAYLTSVEVIQSVLGVIPLTGRVWVDDVFVTGLAVQKANSLYVKQIGFKDESEEYVYYHWELSSGMDLIREWARSSLNFSPWSFILVEHGPDYEADCRLIWGKIHSVHFSSLEQSNR